MGESVYYFKAKFATQKAAKEAMPKIEAFLKEGKWAEDWWQDHRGSNPKTFWPAFEKEFPQVTAYLKRANLFGDDCNNALSGVLDMAEHENELGLSRDGAVLSYASGEIWHGSTWKYLHDYLCKNFPIVKFVWDTEESGFNLETLQLYDWEAIVEAIVKKGDPATLLGIHEDLDGLLEERLKTKKEK